MSVDNPIQWIACTRKRKYKTQANAFAELKKIKKKGLLIPDSANAYKCIFCSGWHLGHNSKKDK